MADVAGGRVYYVWDIPREFMGHNFVSGLRTDLKNLKKLKTVFKKTRLLPALICSIVDGGVTAIKG